MHQRNYKLQIPDQEQEQSFDSSKVTDEEIYRYLRDTFSPNKSKRTLYQKPEPTPEPILDSKPKLKRPTNPEPKLQLQSHLQTQLKPKPESESPQYLELLKMVNALKNEVDALKQEKPDSDMSELLQELDVLKKQRVEDQKRIIGLEKEIKDLKQISELSKSKKKAETKILKALIKDPYQELYWRSLYHTLNDCFDSYRAVKTGLMVSNQAKKETTGRKIAKQAVSGLNKLLSDIPIVSKIAKITETVVTWKINRDNKEDFNIERDAVCSFLRYHKDQDSELEEDIGLCCYTVAIKLAAKKKDNILKALDKKNLEKLREAEDDIFKIIWDEFKGESSNTMTTEQYAVYCVAIKDVTLILAHIFQHWRDMVDSKDKMEDQFINIVMNPQK